MNNDTAPSDPAKEEGLSLEDYVQFRIKQEQKKEPTHAQWNAALDLARNSTAATEESKCAWFNDPVTHNLTVILDNWKREIEQRIYRPEPVKDAMDLVGRLEQGAGIVGEPGHESVVLGPEAAALIQSSFEAWKASDPGNSLGGFDNSYDAVRLEINRLHGIMEAAPDKFKMGYSVSIGGILNAYREGDIAFEKAKDALSSIASRQSASEPSGEAFAVWAEEHAQYGGASREFYERLASFCRSRASRPAPTDEKALRDALALACEWLESEDVTDEEGRSVAEICRSPLLSHESPKEQV